MAQRLHEELVLLLHQATNVTLPVSRPQSDSGDTATVRLPAFSA